MTSLWNANLVREYSSLSADELEARFCADEETLEWSHSYRKSAFEWVGQNMEQIRQGICHTPEIRAYIESSDLREQVLLYNSVADVVLSYFTGLACMVITEIIMRRGIMNLCKPIWDAGA